MDDSRTNAEHTPERIDVEKEKGVLSHSVEHTPEKIDVEKEKGVLSHSVEHTPEKIDVEKERGILANSVEQTPEKIDVEKEKGVLSHSVEHTPEKVDVEKEKVPLSHSVEHASEKIEDEKGKGPLSHSVEHTPEKIEVIKEKGPLSRSVEYTPEKIEDEKEKGPSFHSLEHAPDKIEGGKEEDQLLHSIDLTPEKIKDKKEKGPLFHCELCDAEIVHRIALEFLPGLGSACIDNTTGDLFNRPATVAVNIRREMVEYLTQRSESFVAESVILQTDPDGEVSDNPYDIISDFVDDFASSKRNFFSRVSGWLLSEKREDNIDDFVQEMELTGFWQIGRREAIAQTVLKNVDFKNIYHCTMKFNSQEELDEHVQQCGFRIMTCPNEGCNATFSTSQLEKHDLLCPFKILLCEQKCDDGILRREMDRHCITVCPMKLTNCPFYQIGCQSAIPQCKTEQHLLDDLHAHLLYVLQLIHKEVPKEDLTKRVEQIEQASSPNQLTSARSVRSLLLRVKDIEAKLGPVEVNTSKYATENGTETTDTVAEIPVETETQI